MKHFPRKHGNTAEGLRSYWGGTGANTQDHEEFVLKMGESW